MRYLHFAAVILLFSTTNLFATDNEKLACLAGIAADIDGNKSFSSDTTNIRFILTLVKKNDDVSAIKVKHTGAMDGMPEIQFKCLTNVADNLYTCANGISAIWFYSPKKHGVITTLGLATLLDEKRANAAGTYNYTCSSF